MLVEEDRVSIGIDNDKTGRPLGTHVRFCLDLDTLGFELALKFAHIGKVVEFLSVAVPAGIEGQHVFVEHSFEQADRCSTVS